MGKWMTLDEVIDEFGVAERTFYRWRQRHPIRAGRVTRRHPIMFHRDDVIEADLKENSGWRRFEEDVTVATCYAGASARNDTQGCES